MFNMSFSDLQEITFLLLTDYCLQRFGGTNSQMLHRATLQDRNTPSPFLLSCSKLYLLKQIPLL